MQTSCKERKWLNILDQILLSLQNCWCCLPIWHFCLGNRKGKYQDLKWEIKWIWRCNAVKVIPVVIDAFRHHLKIYPQLHLPDLHRHILWNFTKGLSIGNSKGDKTCSEYIRPRLSVWNSEINNSEKEQPELNIIIVIMNLSKITTYPLWTCNNWSATLIFFLYCSNYLNVVSLLEPYLKC